MGNEYAQIKAVYLIPFVNHVGEGLKGVMDGFLQFDSTDTYSLIITPGPALINEVHRVTLSAAGATGFFRIKYKNSITDPLAYNTTAANVKAAIEALKDVRTENTTVTVSATLAAGTTVDFTWSSNFLFDGNQSLLQIIDNSMQSSVPAQVSATTTRQTAGNNGFTTGAYTIACFAYKYEELNDFRDTEKVTEL